MWWNTHNALPLTPAPLFHCHPYKPYTILCCICCCTMWWFSLHRHTVRFLAEYQRLDPTIQDGYIPIDCADILPGKVNPVGTRLYELLEITHISAVHVAHCFHSFGVVVDSTAFGRVVYSGDCRPSERLVQVGQGADLLIHEATFEDGMEGKLHVTHKLLCFSTLSIKSVVQLIIFLYFFITL